MPIRSCEENASRAVKIRNTSFILFLKADINMDQCMVSGTMRLVPT